MITIFLKRYISSHATILVLLITLLTACSSTRLIYIFVDEFIQDEVAYFLDLDSKEEVLLRQQVSEMVEWHRTFMLPSYSSYLTDLADKFELGHYGTDDITKALENARSLIEKTVIGLTPHASKFLVRHQTVKTIEFMKKRMAKRQEERLMELSKPEEILYEERLERLTSNFERFFGNLTNPQVMLLEAYTLATLGDSRIRLHNRTLRQKVFVSFLGNKPTEAELTLYLNKLLLRGHLITNPAYKSFSEGTLEQFRDLLVNILASSSAKQQSTIISKLRDYAEDFKAVSG